MEVCGETEIFIFIYFICFLLKDDFVELPFKSSLCTLKQDM